MDVLEDLEYRGLVYQTTDAPGLRAHLSTPRAVYAGFDPTAPSLTIGNLVPLLMLMRFQRAGHKPVALVGGGTGLIGDPSGKSGERPLSSAEVVRAYVEGQRRIFERVLDFSGPNAAVLVNNADWLEKLGFVEVLRDIGKFFSVNMMIQKDSVRERLTAREQGITYTEFSYMLLQAYDFRHLYDARAVTLQLAGSDQWGNIVAGIDLIHRTRRDATVFGLTAPLITKADGTKFGKTESGAIWLSADRTSPYAFYQFWLNTQDADVIRYLKVFTLLDVAIIEELERAHAEDPAARRAHRALAAHVTELLHGPAGLAQAEAATEALFSGDVTGLTRELLEEVFATAPSATIARGALLGPGMPVADFLVAGEVAKSKREARELLSSHAIVINGRKAELDGTITIDWLLYGEIAAVRRGKKTWHLIRAR
jgi:tyrosyl-tRNA synthetase